MFRQLYVEPRKSRLAYELEKKNTAVKYNDLIDWLIDWLINWLIITITISSDVIVA